MANDLKIFCKPYEPSDTLALLPLYQELGYPTTLEALQKRLTNLLSNKDYRLLLALSDGHICGFVAFAKLHFFEKDGSYLRILGLVVGRCFRRQGVGKSLLDEVKRVAKTESCKAIALNSGNKASRQAAHHFYQANGFLASSTGFTFEMSF
ncbi:GNAT family N-acetyltransferase [Streptococcus phocae subsp. salmonis]|uniref:GNAT family N-acetyltransferase n=1 Tax=Streptococcus phocae TaxID=119224 RepID=UPI0005310593|nr:GNAT family N-acetyltransferase [Streptococcus phocae]KGR73066.1 hypothetical protein NX86_02635 [Streptococcus phocae subsp. salmonis]